MKCMWNLSSNLWFNKFEEYLHKDWELLHIYDLSKHELELETSELTYQLPRERKKVNPKEQRNKKEGIEEQDSCLVETSMRVT